MFKDIEIILVDNQSNDKTVDRAKSVFPEIKLVEIIDFKPVKCVVYFCEFRFRG